MPDKNGSASAQRARVPVVEARIAFDSLLLPQPSARPAGVSGRHLLFVDQDVDFHVEVAGGRLKEIHGEVISRLPAETPAVIVLLIDKDLVYTRRADANGEFSFENVPAGNLTVEIVLPSRRIAASFTV